MRYGDWFSVHYDELILAVKMKNALKKANKTYEYPLKFEIKNILVNGQKRGCSGFVTNLNNGSCVYINTEPVIEGRLGILYRYAKDDKDYKGYTNRWTGRVYTVDSLANNILKLLDKTPEEARDCRI